MKKAEQKDYANYIQHIDGSDCGAVYPYSIAEGFQRGDIFSENGAFLFWHYCGFAFLYGEYDGRFLEDVSKTFLDSGTESPRRFILFTADANVERFFRDKENVAVGRRIFFEYKKERPALDIAPPAGYDLRGIDGELLKKTNGSVTPSFSWDNPADFEEKGMGYCVTDGNNAASWAFTAAVSGEEIDIGIETAAGYRNLGLAALAAQRMIRYCLEQNKRPVWACRSDNIASGKLAEKQGFVKVSECWTIGKSSG